MNFQPSLKKNETRLVFVNTFSRLSQVDILTLAALKIFFLFLTLQIFHRPSSGPVCTVSSALTFRYNYLNISHDRPCNLSELCGQDLAHYQHSSRNSFSYKHKRDSHSNVIYSLLPMRRRSKQWPLSREGCSTVSWNVPTQRREGFCVYMDERALRVVTSAPGQRPPRDRRHILKRAAPRASTWLEIPH